MSDPVRDGNAVGQRLREACAALERRLRAGDGDAADVLREFPDVAAEPDAALELIYTEFVVREERGEHPSPDEWCGRFPRWESDLRELFRVHGHLWARAGEHGPTQSGEDPDRTTLGDTAAGPGPAGRGAAGEYELLGEIGRGGMGVVYKARQRRLDRIVALKMLLGGEHADPGSLARFQREAEAIARLHHPHIVQVHEVGWYEGTPFFSMEYVDGGTLGDRIAGGIPTPREAAGLVEQLARAIDCAHRQGVVHRDLKPANVLLCKDEGGGMKDETKEESDSSFIPPPSSFRPKITDFGLAKLTSGRGAQTHSGAVMGTPGYMAPEQAAGDAKRVGPAADVYGLGAVLYECLTGRPPFEGPALEVLLQVLEDAPVPPSRVRPSVPRDLETVCLKCLEKDPARRYASAADLAADLRRFLDDQPVLARHPSVTYRLAKFARRNKVLVAGVAAVFLALVAGLVGTGVGLARANAERERAESAERDVRRALTESYAQAADLALQRGAWRAALGNLDKALEAGHPDQARLRLDKVQALAAVHELPAAEAELRELSRRSDLGDLEGRVLLWRADLAIARTLDDAGLELVREALARPLPPADREFALGLLAPTVPEATGHFRRALVLDQFHHRSLGMLGLLLVILGDPGEARELVVLARRVYDEDPTFVVLQAMLNARNGNVKAARAEVEVARGQLGERQFAVVRAVIGLVEATPHLERLMGVGSSFEQVLALKGFLTAAWNFSSTVAALREGPDGTGGDLMLPAPPSLTRSLRRVGGVLMRAGLSALSDPTDEAIEELRQVTEVHPDALFYYILGIAQGNRKRLSEAEQAFRRAAEGFSIVPVRRAALWALMYCRWQLFDQEATGNAAAVASAAASVARSTGLRRQALESVHGLLRFGELRPDESSLAAVIALGMGEVDLARNIVRAWERRAADGDLTPIRMRMRVESRAEAHGAVITAAETILRRTPGDKEALGCREESVKRLREQAERYRSPGGN